jgi:Nickel responsive protein SCO4226-like
MVYVVERYLPGLIRSDLLRGLSRLEQVEEQVGEGRAVRYLGSTIVLGDEACFCQFEGPTEAAVAEANRKAGLPFDRIVPAVTVKTERRTSMSVSASIPATVQIRRTRLLGLIGLVAALAAAVTWVVLEFAVGTGSEKTQVAATSAVAESGAAALDAQGKQAANLVGSMTPAERRSISYYLFGASASLSPAERQTVRDYWFGASTPLTPAQLRSISHYLFGVSTPLTQAELQSIRNYWLGASAGS